MAEGSEVIVTKEQLPILTPSEVVENATTQAKLLMDIVKQTKCYQTISGKQYLQVEAWETIGAFNRTHAETKEIKPIAKDDEVIGYEAHVQLWRDGIVIGGAIMPCYFTENCCKGKVGNAKHKACMSAAQTFATSKAYRMNYSYVAILAGFQPTPAEEMVDDSGGHQTSQGKSSKETGVEDGETIDLKTLEFKNPGEFYTACLKHFKLAKSRVDAEVPEYDLTNAEQRQKAWQQILAIYGQG